MKEVVKKWLEYAEEDLKVAENCFKRKFFKCACFHSHQAVEKVLKALLIKHKKELIKTHNLIYLYSEVKRFIISRVNEDKLDFLNSIYIDSRYPTDLGLLPSGEPLKEDAEKALKYAEELFGILKKEV